MGSSNAHAVLNAALALHAQDNGLAPVHLIHLGARLQLVAEFVKGQEPGSPRLVQCLGSGLSLGFAVIEEVLVPLAKIITYAQLGVILTRPKTTAELANDTQTANRATIQTQATNALANNRTYLAIATPTTAQMRAQIDALTRQHQGMIRLLLGQLDGTN